TDADGNPLTAQLVAKPSHGTVTLNADGSFTYTPSDPKYFGPDSFTYQDNDGITLGNIATVSLTIKAPPTATDDSYIAGADTTLNVTAAKGVLANDKDLNGDSLTTILVAGPSHGNLTLNADGSFTYAPTNPTYSGPDSFTYQASDGVLKSNTATVSLTIS